MEAFAEIAAVAASREPALGGGAPAERRGRAGSPCSRPWRRPGSSSASRRSTRPTSSTTAARGCSCPGEESERVLLGDYLYAHGLVRVSDAGGVEAVAAMAELISRCASLRAAGEDGDGDAWVAAARALGGEPSGDEIAAALHRHEALVGTGTIPR